MANAEKLNMDSKCRVHLEMFEGPLDLLLFLIKRDEIDIYDIPISHVVKEYICFLDRMEELNLTVAGEYLLMAALLLSIKARLLLPVEDDQTGEIEDPRQELVDMLVQYQFFKQISDDLAKRREEQQRLFQKGAFPDLALSQKYREQGIQMDIYSLARVAWELLREQNKIVTPQEGEDVDVKERMEYIVNFLKNNKRAQFVDLFPGTTTPLMFVGTFVALLELVREKSVRVNQHSAFSAIWIYPVREQIGELRS